MSLALFSRSPDLQRLRDDGYVVQVQDGYLVMREVPYVDAQKRVCTGSLVSSLTLAGDQTQPPDTHVMYFAGDFPCQADGTPIQGIAHQTLTQRLGPTLEVMHSFSNKPEGGYPDYYAKMTTYANILAGPAAVLAPSLTARVGRDPEVEEANVFHYLETASGRVGIGALNQTVMGERVAIVGLGGTGSYVLDLVAKTHVAEIRLFDEDDFLQHNAFRAPGAASLDELRQVPKKVDYFKGIYERMRNGIVAHAVAINAVNAHLLDSVTFAFLCLDDGDAKRVIIEKLEAIGASFVDVGMGLELDEGSLGGILRVTSSTPQKRGHVHEGRIPLAGGGAGDVYASNIQVADLNALNATLAVIKWKKIRGFYRDLEREHHSTYTTDGNALDNAEFD